MRNRIGKKFQRLPPETVIVVLGIAGALFIALAGISWWLFPHELLIGFDGTVAGVGSWGRSVGLTRLAGSIRQARTEFT